MLAVIITRKYNSNEFNPCLCLCCGLEIEDNEKEAEEQKMEVMMELNSNASELLLPNNDKEQQHKEATGNIDEWLWNHKVIYHFIAELVT